MNLKNTANPLENFFLGPRYKMKICQLRYPKLIPVLIFLALTILYLSFKNFSKELQKEWPGVDFQKVTGEFDPKEQIAFFEGKEIPVPRKEIIEAPLVMGISSEEKWIEVDLSDQKLIAWEGNKIFLESPISSGKWYPTPTGEFRIWAKLKYTKMEGGIKGTSSYYYLPNVPYTMYFFKGFGLHGTYWHNNFGQPMSHGCVNLPTPVAEKLFWWTLPVLPPQKNYVIASKNNLGTKVVIHQ